MSNQYLYQCILVVAYTDLVMNTEQYPKYKMFNVNTYIQLYKRFRCDHVLCIFNYMYTTKFLINSIVIDLI